MGNEFGAVMVGGYGTSCLKRVARKFSKELWVGTKDQNATAGPGYDAGIRGSGMVHNAYENTSFLECSL